MNKFVMIFVTADSFSSAKKISQSLVEKRLVACANIVPKIESVFWWKEKIDKASEVLLILKTKKDLFDKVVDEVKLLHSYEVPEIIALPVACGSKEYLDWIEKEVEE